jgi:hypothetical protein
MNLKTKAEVWDGYVCALLAIKEPPVSLYGDFKAVAAKMCADAVAGIADAMLAERIKRFGEITDPVSPEELMKTMMTEMRQTLDTSSALPPVEETPQTKQ